MRLLLLCVLLACSDEKPKTAVEQGADRAAEAAHEAKKKAVEVAQNAAREAERAAEVAQREAEKAKQELLAAADELKKTTADRAKLQEQGRDVVEKAKAKLATMKDALDKLAKEVEQDPTVQKRYDQAKQAYDELATSVRDLESSIAK